MLIRVPHWLKTVLFGKLLSNFRKRGRMYITAIFLALSLNSLEKHPCFVALQCPVGIGRVLQVKLLVTNELPVELILIFIDDALNAVALQLKLWELFIIVSQPEVVQPLEHLLCLWQL